ncbi:NAD(P)/FAD-dependent oxidoreductase [Bradyrhizobium sp. STM 3557]|uniref:NAD(P)/FAD-dependent oxidoreductase n=1 Tax=Bradyrhizobium sp. STM 3557 TaxID=578920 RepID=UPI00388FD05F
MARILILGAGFAGLWAAIGAARKLDELQMPHAAEILVVDRNPYHNIRVRNYEIDLSEVALPLAHLLDPIGVQHRVAEVIAIDPIRQEAIVEMEHGRERLNYDRLVLTLGSELMRPAIPGLASHGFDVDSYAAAIRLHDHLSALGRLDPSPGRSTVVVAGAGLTGIEVATEMPRRLAQAGIDDPHIILLDRNPVIGAAMGDAARPVIDEALAALDVETRPGVEIAAVDSNGITLRSGEFIPALTLVWCAGMAASPLTAATGGERDRLGRLVVNEFMQAVGLKNVFAAGDAAVCKPDGVHPTVMSCQFARPMGRFAGHNVIADLFGQPMLPLHIDWYVTVLDLGAWGALYTTGWDRQVSTTGSAAKATKLAINHERIYPPLTGSRADLFAAAAPIVQAPPPLRKQPPA